MRVLTGSRSRLAALLAAALLAGLPGAGAGQASEQRRGEQGGQPGAGTGQHTHDPHLCRKPPYQDSTAAPPRRARKAASARAAWPRRPAHVLSARRGTRGRASGPPSGRR